MDEISSNVEFDLSEHCDPCVKAKENRNIQQVINISLFFFTIATVKEFIKPEMIQTARETSSNLHGYETQSALSEYREQ